MTTAPRLIVKNLSTSFPTEDGLVRSVAESKVTFSADDAASEPRLSALEGRAGAFAAIPLVVRDELVGVLAIGARHSVSDASSALATVADLLALGLARGRAEEERITALERERAASCNSIE